MLSLGHCSPSAAPNEHEVNHLCRNRSGLYLMRLTVDRGAKYVGERIKISLRTHDREEAKQRRDVVMVALTKAKVAMIHN